MRDVKIYIFNKKYYKYFFLPLPPKGVRAHKKKTKRKRKLIRNFFLFIINLAYTRYTSYGGSFLKDLFN